MEKFICVTGIAAVMPQQNIDTDVIIPMNWLQRLGVDYGQGLFAGQRFRDDGSEDPTFILNRNPVRSAKIIIAGDNFGCGSSREHAVWALAGFGIRCLIAPSFGEIFASNCFRNGVLPITLPPAAVQSLADVAESGSDISVDLREFAIRVPDGRSWRIDIDPMRRDMLLAGEDETAFSLSHLAHIEAYEMQDRLNSPWRYASVSGRESHDLKSE